MIRVMFLEAVKLTAQRRFPGRTVMETLERSYRKGDVVPANRAYTRGESVFICFSEASTAPEYEVPKDLVRIQDASAPVRKADLAEH